MKILLIPLILFFSYDAFSQFIRFPESTLSTVKDYSDRAYEKEENGDYYGAISDLNKAIELDPDFDVAYYNRGFSKIKSGRNAGAIEDFTKAIELDPDDADAYNSRGVL